MAHLSPSCSTTTITTTTTTASSSLSLLLPQHSYPSSPPSRHAPPTPSTFSAATADFSRSETAALLEANSRAIIDSINTRNYAAVKGLAAKTTKSDMDSISKNSSYNADEVAFEKMAMMNPNYHIEVVNVAADVDEQSGYAVVYCLFNVTGQPLNIKRQSVSVVEWMRRDGKWQFYNSTSLRGLDGTGLPSDHDEPTG